MIESVNDRSIFAIIYPRLKLDLSADQVII